MELGKRNKSLLSFASGVAGNALGGYSAAFVRVVGCVTDYILRSRIIMVKPFASTMECRMHEPSQ